MTQLLTFNFNIMELIIKKLGIAIATLSLSISTFAYDFKVDNICYNINKDKETVNVTKPEKNNYSGDVIIPETVQYKGKQYTITGIDNGTFNNSKALRSVVLPSTINKLPSFTFYNCTALNKIVLNDNLEMLPDNCFLSCSALHEINIPKGVTTIGEAAFKDCTSITSLTIPENVTRIEYEAFLGCKALSHITFSDSQNRLRIGYGNNSDRGAFIDCPLYDIYMGRNISNLYTNYYKVFSEHPTLSKVTLGKNVTKIYPRLFQECNALESIIVEGPNLKEIQTAAFKGCSNLKEFKGNALNSVEIIGNTAFQFCNSLKEIVLPQITTVGDWAFSGGNLEKVFLGDNIAIIPQGCFTSQTSLKYVYLGSSVTSIETGVFHECFGLINIFLFSDKLVTLGESAIPTNVSKIYVPNPSRYDNILNNYYLDYLAIINPISATYSGSVPNFSYINNVIDTNLNIVPSIFNSNVGEYNGPISVKFSYGDWSSTALINCIYKITPATITIIANDASKKYGSENPELTCSFFGFKNNETKDVLTRLPNVETTATASSNVGTYPIIPSGAEAQNYTFNYERGTLTITKADQTIEWEQQLETANVGDIIELTATSSAGLPIKYSSTDESIAEIFTQAGKKFVEFLKPGNVSIRANQEGNENYNEADRISKKITVTTPFVFVTSLVFNPTEWNGIEKSNFHISATIQPDNATNRTLEWSSSNEQVAVVDNNGNVEVLIPGDCVITAKTTDGSNISAECHVKALSGIDDIVVDVNKNFDVYNAHGVLIYKSASKDMLKSLHSGIYIIKQNSSIHKIIIN